MRDPALDAYLLAHSTPADPILSQLAAETRTAFGDRAGMQISADEGALLTMLVQLIGAANAVEVGTFTGYSSICIARGLAPGGRLLCCDVSATFTGLARQYWRKAGVEDRIELRLAPALETLQALPDNPIIDFAFVDADKTGYAGYYAELVPRLRPGGLLVLDNVLRGGEVVVPHPVSASVVAMRHLNDLVAADDRVDTVMLPVRDGVTLARKR
ncbi:O-methyltransferase [Symbioplanes lichenis]|uniref:O-methyltransferase n=1 Tax=Symbioplanes lichenis TaxID=1629072 RepID=UPI002738A8CC|nr:O-methyltransferase [Actinoplanes lichenis]